MVMRQMRENTKWIMLITALAFVLLIVFEWGMDLTGRSTGLSGGDVGRVNGEAVTADEYLAVYRNIYQQQQNALQGSITPVIERQISDAAWDQVVTQKLLEQELNERGIQVSDQEIRDAAQVAPPPELQAAPAFQTDGQFDITKYHQFLASPALDDQFLQQLEAYYRDVIPRSKLYFQNTAGVYVSDGQLWRMYRDANEAATVRFIAFNPERLVREVSVPDQAVQQYYNAHRDEFIRPAQVSVRYVAFSRAPTAADSAAARQQAEQYRAAVAGGEDFETVARRASGSDSVSRMYGESFRVARGQSAPALEQAVFSTAVGQVSAPVLTQSGYHVVKVESRQGDTAQVRQLLVPVELAREAEDRLLDRVDSLETAAASQGLAAAAQRLGLQVRTADITPALPVLPGVGSVDEAVEWALEEAEIGQVSDVFENEQSYYLVELVGRRTEGPLTLQEATPSIRVILERQHRLQRARELLADAERRARGGEALETIAGAHNLSVQQAGPFTRSDVVPGLGRLNAAIGAAFGLQPGQTSPLIEADGQLFLLRSVARQEPSRAEWQAQLPQQRARVLQALGDTRWQQYLLALRENAKIVDNRKQVLRRGTGVVQ